MSLYTDILRDLLYYNKDKFSFLVYTGLYNRFLESVITLQKLRDLYENESVEDLLRRLHDFERLRDFAVDYAVMYILYKNPNNKEIAQKVAELINFQVSVIINYINAALETTLTKVKGFSSRVLFVSRLLSYFAELITYFEDIFVRDPNEIISYILYKSQYISYLIESRAKVAKQIKELEKSIEEIATEKPTVEQETESDIIPSISDLSSAVSDAKLEYLKSSSSLSGVVPKKIFNKRELEVLILLLQRGIFYPKATMSVDELAIATTRSSDEIIRIINSIWDKCKTYNIPLFIRVDRTTDPSTNKELLTVSIDPELFKKAAKRIAPVHPELIDLFIQQGYGL